MIQHGERGVPMSRTADFKKYPNGVAYILPGISLHSTRLVPFSGHPFAPYISLRPSGAGAQPRKAREAVRLIRDQPLTKERSIHGTCQEPLRAKYYPS